MTTHHNIAANTALVRSFIEHIWNHRQIDHLHDYLSEDYIDHAYQPSNAAGLTHMLAQLAQAFPDARQTIDALTAQDDTVVCRITLTATHLGEFRNITATGKAVRVSVYRSYRVTDGKIGEHWALLDTAHLLRQLGATVSEQNACACAA